MKLKKITSLALAGVMAVSMLAGCSNNGGSNNDDNNDDVVVTPSTTAVVNAVNNGQSILNDVKITFTANADLETAMQKAIDVYGSDATATNVENAVKNMTGLESKAPNATWTTYNKTVLNGSFLSDKVIYATDYASPNNEPGKEGGTVYTLFGVEEYTGNSAITEEAVLNTIAAAADEAIKDLDLSSDRGSDGKLTVTVNKKYYGYSYDGSIAMVAVEQANGTTDYFVAYVVNQTITEKTL